LVNVNIHVLLTFECPSFLSALPQEERNKKGGDGEHMDISFEKGGELEIRLTLQERCWLDEANKHAGCLRGEPDIGFA
jgi:hypothetical protein